MRIVGVDDTNHPTNTFVKTWLKSTDAMEVEPDILDFLDVAAGYTIPTPSGDGMDFYYLRTFNRNWGTSGGGGGYTLKLGNQQKRHTRHEAGHCFGFGHSCKLARFNEKKSDRYPAFQDKVVGRKVPDDLKE
ncbi:Hypothetical Protein FCC1311_107992 [Hondaea fermentalgiana]|uniref:Uncharacterized protein n=1 Tax=Hondaea fermentalgiana TaxID=2315210 RepID=A0A2R5GXR2_9STRA|nr:Hypothetical Protein FCC1311_107992 [Hondaea fermentalgiana]|eukprot:GBG34578.1 Hypothetical Protein FCC1311_107992 [Hondaea fermentalgiana]